MNQAMQGHQDKWVIVKSSDKMWSTGEGNGNPLPYSCLENSTDIMKKEKDMMLEDEPPQVRRYPSMLQGKSGGQLLTAPVRMKVWRKWKQHSPVDVWLVKGKLDSVNNNIG